MKVFTVSKVADWQSVAEYLLITASGSPLPEPDSVNYSKSEAEVFERTERLLKAGRVKEAVQFSAVALYRIKSDIVISLVLTVEPSKKALGNFSPTIHLSMVQVIPNTENPRLRKLDNRLALEIAHSILHVHEERHEGALSEVRHFFRNVS